MKVCLGFILQRKRGFDIQKSLRELISLMPTFGSNLLLQIVNVFLTWKIK